MIKIKNWSKYQSYKDRKPPWIRFHREILDDYKFQSMSVDARATLPMLWLLACEHENPKAGLVTLSLREISFRLRNSYETVTKIIEELQSADFIEYTESVTNPYQNRNQTVTPETETDTDTEKLIREYSRDDVSVNSNSTIPVNTISNDNSNVNQNNSVSKITNNDNTYSISNDNGLTGESQVSDELVDMRDSAPPPVATNKQSPEEFLAHLKSSPAYQGIDIDRELVKMDEWLRKKPGRRKTRQFVINWLNRIDVVPPGLGKSATPGVVMSPDTGMPIPQIVLDQLKAWKEKHK